MPMPYWWMIVPAFGATLAGAAVLYYVVERRFSLAQTKPAVPEALPVPDAVVARSRAA